MAAWLALLVGSVLVWDVAPTVSVGDSGELIAAAVTVGVPHPPGYPWYVVWTHLMTRAVPLGSLGFRAAFGSTVAAMAACALMVQLVRRWGANRWVAGWTGALLAAGQLFGAVSVQAEVYALAALIWLGWVYAWSEWRKSRSPQWGWCSALLAGIAVSHHQVALLLLPWWVIDMWRSGLNRKIDGWAVGLLGSMAVSIFLFLPLRGLAGPDVSWGHIASFHQTLAHVIREQYGAVSTTARTWTHFAGQVSEMGRVMWHQWWAPWGALAALAVAWWWTQARWSVWAPVGAALSVSVGVVALLNQPATAEWRSIVEVFYLPACVATVLGLGGALGAVRYPSRLIEMGVIALLWAMVVVDGMESRPARHAWNHRLGYAFGRNLLASLPAAGRFLVSGDNQLFTLVYLQSAEGWRPDAVFIEEESQLTPAGGSREAARALHHPHARVAMWSGWEHRAFGSDGHPVPAGLTYATVPLADGEGLRLWRRYDWSGWRNPPGEYAHRLVSLQYYYLLGAWEAERGRDGEAKRWLRQGERLGWDVERFHYNVGVFYAKMGWFEEAEQAYRRAIALFPEYVLPYSNLGVVLLNQGRMEEAVTCFREAVRLAPERPDGYVNLGASLARLGRMAEAVNVWKTGLIRAPRHPLLESNLRQAVSAQGAP